MKVLFIGDPHLKINKFDLAKQFLSWINGVVEKHNVDLVVNLGDTFDTHAVVRSEILTEFLSHVEQVNKTCPYVYLLGNHDMFKPNDNKYHALKHLKGKIKEFIIVDEVINLYGMTFVPYVYNSELFPKESLQICVAHQTFKGADFGDITTKDGVDPSSVAGAEIIISGHIHKRQRMVASERGGPEVFYIGSPFSQSASDINQVKGVSIFDTDSFKETFVPCPLPQWKGLRYELSSTFSTSNVHEDLVNHLSSKDHWVIEITGPRSEIASYLESKKAKEILNGLDVKIKTVFTDSQKRQVQIEALSLNQIVSEYIVKIYSGGLDKELLKQKAVELIDSLNSK